MRVTEKKRIKIDRECKSSPIYCAWLNTLGGRDYWLFDKNQTEGLVTSNEGNFEPYTEDIENSRGQIVDISIFAQPQLICYGVIESEDLVGLKTMLYSPNVEILTNPDTWEAEGCKWEIYRPQPGSFKIIDVIETRNTFEVTFDKPYINNVSQ